VAEKIPRWADEQISEDMASLREVGENLRVEFKADFPTQIHELAKELAAFGTSGGGFLFIGVNDNCESVGVEASNGDARDELIRRVRGIVSMVKPELKSRIGFAVEDVVCILFVEVSVQDEPVFYYNGRPYIRNNDESRPATPEEVKESVWAHPSSSIRREEQQIELEKKKHTFESDQQLLTDIRSRYWS